MLNKVRRLFGREEKVNANEVKAQPKKVLAKNNIDNDGIIEMPNIPKPIQQDLRKPVEALAKQFRGDVLSLIDQLAVMLAAAYIVFEKSCHQLVEIKHQLKSKMDAFNLDSIVNNATKGIEDVEKNCKGKIRLSYVKCLEAESAEGKKLQDLYEERTELEAKKRQLTIGIAGDEDADISVVSYWVPIIHFLFFLVVVGGIEAAAGYDQFRRASNVVSAYAASLLTVIILSGLAALGAINTAVVLGHWDSLKRFRQKYGDGKDMFGQPVHIFPLATSTAALAALATTGLVFCSLSLLAWRIYQIYHDPNSNSMVALGTFALVIMSYVYYGVELFMASPFSFKHQNEYADIVADLEDVNADVIDLEEGVENENGSDAQKPVLIYENELREIETIYQADTQNVVTSVENDRLILINLRKNFLDRFSEFGTIVEDNFFQKFIHTVSLLVEELRKTKGKQLDAVNLTFQEDELRDLLDGKLNMHNELSDVEFLEQVQGFSIPKSIEIPRKPTDFHLLRAEVESTVNTERNRKVLPKPQSQQKQLNPPPVIELPKKEEGV